MAQQVLFLAVSKGWR